VEYFVISSGCPELYKEVTKIIEDWGISHRIKVVKSAAINGDQQKKIKNA
jgi:hypothetical protein